MKREHITGSHRYAIGLERRCNLSWAEVAPASASEALAQAAAATAAAARRRADGDALHRRLHAFGSHGDPAISRAALRLRRDLFNQRVPGQTDPQLQDALDADSAAALARWRASVTAEQSLAGAAAASFQDAVQRARLCFAGLILDNHDFACGLQTANRRVYAQARSYAEAVRAGARLDKKLRNTEDRVASFVYKVVSKPSPFASFATIVPSGPAAAGLDRARREVRIARDLLLWMEAQCVTLAATLADALPLRLNNTVRTEDGRVRLFTRGKDGTPDMLHAERFIELKHSPALSAVLGAFGGAAPTLPELSARLCGPGRDPQPGRVYLDTLLKAGLIERDFGIPDQAPDFAARAAQLLKSLPDGRGAPFDAIFGDIARIESALSATRSAAERTPLTAALFACFRRFAEALSIAPDALMEVRDIYYEDVGGIAAGASPAPLLAPDEQLALDRLTPLLMLFDSQLTSRLSLHSIFRELYGAAGAAVSLLDFYQAYRALPKEDLFARLTGARDPAIARIDALRKQFAALAARACAGAADGQADLAQGEVAAWIDTLAPQLDARSVSFFLQDLEGGAHSKILNNAGTGFGSAMSRFAGLFDGPRASLAGVLAGLLTQVCADADVLDIGAVLAANSNLHPAIAPGELMYPGARRRGEGGPALSLAAIEVVSQDGQLRLRHAGSGRPIEFVSHNFIHPGAGPALYRFLHLFSKHWIYRAQDLLDAVAGAAGPQAGNPRLCFGPIVLCRRVVAFDAAAIQQAAAGEDDYASFLGLNAWRERMQLPRIVFFRAQALAPLQDGGAELALERILALRRGRLRKPHVLDFHNPFLVRVFLKQVASLAPGDTVQLQESLPDFNRAPEGAAPVRELIVQADHVR